MILLTHAKRRKVDVLTLSLNLSKYIPLVYFFLSSIRDQKENFASLKDFFKITLSSNCLKIYCIYNIFEALQEGVRSCKTSP